MFVFFSSRNPSKNAPPWETWWGTLSLFLRWKEREENRMGKKFSFQRDSNSLPLVMGSVLYPCATATAALFYNEMTINLQKRSHKIVANHSRFLHRWKAESKCQQFGSDSHLASCLTEAEIYLLAFQKQKDDSNSFFIGLSDMWVISVTSKSGTLNKSWPLK